MKILKLEQPDCPNCIRVATFLEGNGVEYDTVDVSVKTEFAAKYKIMSTPVTVLLDDEGNEAQRSAGFNPAELAEMISKL